MKKMALLFSWGILMAGSPVMALGLVPVAPSSVPMTQGAAAPSASATAQPTPGLPIFYFAVGAGTALIGNGFGTEGNPWLDSSTATLASGYGASFNPSEAFDALVGFNLDKSWSLDLSLENYSFTTAPSSASNETNVVPALRYTLASDAVEPYFMAGLGFNFNTTSAVVPVSILSMYSSAQAVYNTQCVTNLVASGGVGLLVNIPGSGHFFAQAQYQQVFTAQGGFSYYPLTIGFQYP